MIHALRIHPAAIQDRGGALLLLDDKRRDDFPRRKELRVDSVYAGRCVCALVDTFGWDVEVVRRPGEGNRGCWCLPDQEPPPRMTGLHLVKWRWIVERTVGWVGRSRRLSKDYEEIPEVSGTFVHLAMSALVLRRLAT